MASVKCAATKEMALRLAWYVSKFGGIPEAEQVTLGRLATFGGKSASGSDLLTSAREIEDYFCQLG
jgi:hypothetical protein